MSAVLKKLDEIAQRAAANHGLNIVEPISEIYGTGSFFKGVAACEPGLVIDCAKTTRPTRRRSVAFLSLCYAGWDEYWQRCSDANAAVEKAWEERASAHLALHPEDGQSAWFKADWDESKNWLRCKFDDPEYNRATAATKPPKTMEEPCVWAVREWCARAGTANPLVVKERNYRGITGKKFDDDLRELFAPLDDEAIAEVLKGWASKLTWDQIRNCALPEDEEIMKHVLLKGVGRFKHFEIRGYSFAEQQGPPADSVLIWSSNEPGTMPSVRLTSVYPDGVGSSQRKRPAAGSSVGDAAGAAPHSKATRTRPPATPAELYELGHAAWLIAHARRWEAIAQACVRALDAGPPSACRDAPARLDAGSPPVRRVACLCGAKPRNARRLRGVVARLATGGHVRAWHRIGRPPLRISAMRRTPASAGPHRTVWLPIILLGSAPTLCI